MKSKIYRKDEIKRRVQSTKTHNLNNNYHNIILNNIKCIVGGEHTHL